jgi:DNA-directed RNA polymerase subunit RPC12/RpoP
MANLAKTKLDAYGIPCFLTGENFTGVYPLRNDIFPGTRLHIFEKDAERVREVLTEEKTSLSGEVQCPQCRSWNVVFEESTAGTMGRLFASLFFFLFDMTTPLPRKKIYHCRDCDTEFDP